MSEKKIIDELCSFAHLVSNDMRTINGKLDRIENKLDKLLSLQQKEQD
jgi:hypothetical protein